ncbi:hypothetical protein BLOT_004258 [Blomia tropicalis]|nr:hypothetical protein BLOT_004258 [Blomia tropicalis]
MKLGTNSRHQRSLSAKYSPASVNNVYSPYLIDPPSHFSAPTEYQSSPVGTESSELDIHSLIDKPKVVNKFIQTASDKKWAEKIATKINIALNVTKSSKVNSDQTQNDQKLETNDTDIHQACSTKNMQTNNDIIELENAIKSISSNQLQDVCDNALSGLQDDSECGRLIDSVILSTPFKIPFINVSTHGSSNAYPITQTSLHTPNILPITPVNTSSSPLNVSEYNSSQVDVGPVVKNLLKDLTTPEKSIRLFSSNGQQSVSLTVNDVFGQSNTFDNQTTKDVSTDGNIKNLSNGSISDDSTLTLSNASPKSEKRSSVSNKNKNNNNSLNSKSLTNDLKSIPKKGQISVSRPVFHNQHLDSKQNINFKPRKKQKVFDSSINKSTLQDIISSPKNITTTIKLVDESTELSDIDSPEKIEQVNDSNDNNSSKPQNGQPLLTNSDQLCYTTATWNASNNFGTIGGNPILLLPSNNGQLFTIANYGSQIMASDQNTVSWVSAKLNVIGYYLINEELYMGTTYLVPKKVNADNPADLRPITCLPNIFKLVSKVVKMGMKINQAKSASNIESDQAFGQQVDEIDGYKYLGILENSQNVVKNENKEILKQKILMRIEALCTTKLNARNFFRGINEFAISTINYYIGILNYEPEEFEQLDKQIRQILAKHNVIRKASNIQRLYISRDELGRGLQNIRDKSEQMLMSLNKYLNSKSVTRPIIEVEKRLATHLGMIEEYLKMKYDFVEEEISRELLTAVQEENRMQQIRDKRMHSIVFQNESGHIDVKQSSLWLKKGNISPQEEGMLCKLQDRNLFFEKRSCPNCMNRRLSVDHLATYCGKYVSFEYKRRHDEIVRCLHFMIAKRYGITHNRRLKNYKVEGVVSNERVRIKSDVPILTENRNVQYNKPDLFIHDLKTNEITMIEIGVTNKNDLPTTELTKGRKYDLLAGEMRSTFRARKVTVIPVVMTWEGLMTKHARRYMKQIGITDQIQAYLQTCCLKRTCDIILKDAKAEIDSDYCEEDCLLQD